MGLAIIEVAQWVTKLLKSSNFENITYRSLYNIAVQVLDIIIIIFILYHFAVAAVLWTQWRCILGRHTSNKRVGFGRGARNRRWEKAGTGLEHPFGQWPSETSAILHLFWEGVRNHEKGNGAPVFRWRVGFPRYTYAINAHEINF